MRKCLVKMKSWKGSDSRMTYLPNSPFTKVVRVTWEMRLLQCQVQNVKGRADWVAFKATKTCVRKINSIWKCRLGAPHSNCVRERRKPNAKRLWRSIKWERQGEKWRGSEWANRGGTFGRRGKESEKIKTSHSRNVARSLFATRGCNGWRSWASTQSLDSFRKHDCHLPRALMPQSTPRMRQKKDGPNAFWVGSRSRFPQIGKYVW